MIAHFHRTIPLTAAQGWVPPAGSGVADIYAAFDAAQKTPAGNSALNPAGGNPAGGASAAAWLGAGGFAAALAARTAPAAADPSSAASPPEGASGGAGTDPAARAAATGGVETGADEGGADEGGGWSLALAGPLLGRPRAFSPPPTTGDGLTGEATPSGTSPSALQAVKSYQSMMRGLR